MYWWWVYGRTCILNLYARESCSRYIFLLMGDQMVRVRGNEKRFVIKLSVSLYIF